MLELLIALGGFGFLVGLALLAILVPPLALVYAAMTLMMVGFVFGVPIGFYYHVVLRRELLKTGALPRRWYLHPQDHHRQLEHAALRRVRPWFFAGAAGFTLIIFGFLIAGVALAVSP